MHTHTHLTQRDFLSLFNYENWIGKYSLFDAVTTISTSCFLIEFFFTNLIFTLSLIVFVSIWRKERKKYCLLKFFSLYTSHNRIRALIFVPQDFLTLYVEKASRVSDYMVEKLSLAYTCSESKRAQHIQHIYLLHRVGRMLLLPAATPHHCMRHTTINALNRLHLREVLQRHMTCCMSPSQHKILCTKKREKHRKDWEKSRTTCTTYRIWESG